jgi:hypothetical protein
MNETTNVLPFRQPDAIDDPLTDILRSGARNLLAQAVEIEAEAFLASMRDLELADGRERLVRHGHGPERLIQTGIGPVEVTPKGRKELVGFQTGVGESAQSWHELLVDIKRRGLAVPPQVAVGDGALGFWEGAHRSSQ